jgi:hypothetical protein
MEKYAPIALFVYNRPQHTLKTLEALKANKLAVETKLFIYSDAAKTTEEEENVAAVREIIGKVTGFKTVSVMKAKTNFGLAQAIIFGVTDLLKQFGRIIVFEDDLISSPNALKYFNDALEFYQDEEKLMHISAYMYPLDPEQDLPDSFIYRAVHSWGWATWQRAWQHFNPDIDALIAGFDKTKINEFSIEGKMNFWKQMQEFKKGKNNSWAIRWYASVFLRGGLSLNPSKSLILNIGHDGSGIHSNKEEMYNVVLNPNIIEYFPPTVKENKRAYLAIKTFLSTRKGNIFSRIVRFIKQKID